MFAPAPPPEPVSYSREVAPIFAMHCNSCHGDSGALSTRTYEHLIAGGNKGQVILKHNAEGSLLIHYIDGRRGENHRMPLGGKPIRPEQIQIIRRWIDEGAREDHASLPRYSRSIEARWPQNQQLSITFRLDIEAHVTLRILDPRTHRVLAEQMGPVKREREDADLGAAGATVLLRFNRAPDWPTTVKVELQIDYAADDPGDVHLSAR